MVEYQQSNTVAGPPTVNGILLSAAVRPKEEGWKVWKVWKVTRIGFCVCMYSIEE